MQERLQAIRISLPVAPATDRTGTLPPNPSARELADPRKSLDQLRPGDLLLQGTAFYKNPESALDYPFEPPSGNFPAGYRATSLKNLLEHGVVFEPAVSDKELDAQGLTQQQITNLHQYASERGIDLADVPSDPHSPKREHRFRWNRSENKYAVIAVYKRRINKMASG